MLIERGADVSVQNEDGSTALHLASRNGHVDLGRMLIERGADISVQNKEGQTAQQVALERGHVDLAQMLERSTNLAPHETPQIKMTT
jgi:ankyrin repeat protein